jgi:hypothetical protein
VRSLASVYWFSQTAIQEDFMKTQSVTWAALVSAVVLAGCAATQANQQGAAVEIVTQKPAGCRLLGEVVGSQGNVFSGDFTTDENLLIGARNDLRNEAAAMGGNVVHAQDALHSTHPNSRGAVKSTVVGSVFACPRK